MLSASEVVVTTQFPVSGRLHGLDPVAHQIEQDLLNLDFIHKPSKEQPVRVTLNLDPTIDLV
jgi:hypothetical protein